MPFNINDLRGSFANYEPASPANYEINVIRPLLKVQQFDGTLTSVSRVVEDNLKFRCISCSLPGRILNVTERNTYGPVRKIATSTLYSDVTFSFIVSDDKSELEYFTLWHNFIINNNPNINPNSKSIQTHDVRYYDDYVGELTISHFDKMNNKKFRIRLNETYPISVEEIPLSWDNTNEFIRVNVTMAYRNWQQTY